MVSRSAISCLLFAALGLAGCDRGEPPSVQANATTPDEVAAAPVAPPRAGTVDRSHAGNAALAVGFEAPDGSPVTLAGFAGKPLLVNLWATWCAPCVAEMPMLDALAGEAGDAMTVLAVSQDMEGAAKVDPYFRTANLRNLKPYRDPKLALSLAYAANLPTTILYDSRGREVWRVTGSLDWTGAEAKALIAEAR